MLDRRQVLLVERGDRRRQGRPPGSAGRLGPRAGTCPPAASRYPAPLAQDPIRRRLSGAAERRAAVRVDVAPGFRQPPGHLLPSERDGGVDEPQPPAGRGEKPAPLGVFEHRHHGDRVPRVGPDQSPAARISSTVTSCRPAPPAARCATAARTPAPRRRRRCPPRPVPRTPNQGRINRRCRIAGRRGTGRRQARPGTCRAGRQCRDHQRCGRRDGEHRDCRRALRVAGVARNWPWHWTCGHGRIDARDPEGRGACSNPSPPTGHAEQRRCRLVGQRQRRAGAVRH